MVCGDRKIDALSPRALSSEAVDLHDGTTGAVGVLVNVGRTLFLRP